MTTETFLLRFQVSTDWSGTRAVETRPCTVVARGKNCYGDVLDARGWRRGVHSVCVAEEEGVP
jgi:hypothetical protein